MHRLISAFTSLTPCTYLGGGTLTLDNAQKDASPSRFALLPESCWWRLAIAPLLDTYCEIQNHGYSHHGKPTLIAVSKENNPMQITIELPDDIANQLQLQPANISRRILELIAADNYRQGRIGAAQVRRMLNFSSRWETYEFLKREKAYLPYTEDDLEQDVQVIRNVLAKE